jgi:hypothetical protein
MSQLIRALSRRASSKRKLNDLIDKCTSNSEENSHTKQPQQDNLIGAENKAAEAAAGALAASEGNAEEEECCICLQSLSLPIQSSCGHIFCWLCLKSVIESHSSYSSNPPACPLCRARLDMKLLNQATVATDDYINQHNSIFYVWKYAGRSSGYWLFEDRANEEIEQSYQNYLKHIRDEVIQAANTHNKQSQHQTANQATSRDDVISCAKTDSDEEEADSTVSVSNNSTVSSVVPPLNNNPYETIHLSVGHRVYLINFARMEQSDSTAPSRKRKIVRAAKEELMAEFAAGKGRGSEGTKGQAGVQFARTESAKKSREERKG